MKFREITPTVFLRRSGDKLQQLVRVGITNTGEVAAAAIFLTVTGTVREFPLGDVPEGESEYELFIDEVTAPTTATFILKCAGDEADRKDAPWQPPRHWTVHVVQLSHHDPGYTDLASNVLPEHDEFLDNTIEMAANTAGFPYDAQFRFVVEQTWSIDHYLRNAPQERAAKMIDVMRSGHVELTALFGNMTTEICGHESLARTAYHAFRLKRLYGIPIVSAEHNDIPGLSWGLSHVLAEAGIKIFCPGFPLYWTWSGSKLHSFWDEKALFPTGDVRCPGAFWWEAPSGKRVLLWCNNGGCGGDVHANTPTLGRRLLELEGQGYPYTVLRWPVGGGGRDNAPYIEGYSHTIREWNEKWAFPHLVCSTNAMFYNDFIKQVPADLPVFRGEIAGPDYPVGATSTALATAVNRNNHSNLLTAEKLATAASFVSDYKYQQDRIFHAYEEVQWYDEHAWGHHFPCGPSMNAAELEKAIRAYRAAAHTHDVTNKAMARIADHVRLETDDYHLVVFTSPARAFLREIDNCGSTMYEVSPAGDAGGVGHLKGVLLQDRWHVNLPREIIDGKFELIDTATGENVPYQIVEIESADATVPYAAQRLGIGSGGRRYGFFEQPIGLKRDLRFIARDVPACGYKTYRFVQREDVPEFSGGLTATPTAIENQYYRVEVDAQSGAIRSIFDKEAGRELIDADAPHAFGDVIVRTPFNNDESNLVDSKLVEGPSGVVCASIERTARVHGHPAIRQTVTLSDGLKRVEFAVRILKDSTPLLDVHLAFPFLVQNPVFRYESALSVMEPIKDYLPGSFSDNIAVQNWVKVGGDDFTVLWSSLDAPIASMGGLWPGYVSPAHSALLSERMPHPPLKPEDLKDGWIYSNVFYNNFGTNFSVTQTGDVLFRYVISSCSGDVSDGAAAGFGWDATTPIEQIITRPWTERTLPASDSLMEVDNESVVLITCKKAEVGDDVILRLWNVSSQDQKAEVHLKFAAIQSAQTTNLVEEGGGEALEHTDHSIIIDMKASTLMTIRVTPKE